MLVSGAGRELQSREMAATALFYFDDFRMGVGCLEVNQRQAKFKYYIESALSGCSISGCWQHWATKNLKNNPLGLFQSQFWGSKLR